MQLQPALVISKHVIDSFRDLEVFQIKLSTHYREGNSQWLRQVELLDATNCLWVFKNWFTSTRNNPERYHRFGGVHRGWLP